MATLGDTLLIHLGIDVEGLKSGLKDAVNRSQKATEEIGAGQEKQINKSKQNISELSRTANGALNNVLGIAKRLAGPVTAALSFGAMLKSYWGGMGQVAQMTGAYYKKLDEWREKMAMLRRYTKEDLELYRRTNRAMTDFRIAMADVGAEIMRSFSPLFKVALDALESFTKFISDHKDDVVRFLKVIGSIIMTLLIPAFVKLGIAMLACPLTWIIAAIGLLALAIDDLLVYLQGGDSTFGAFWGPCVEYAKQAWEWIQKIYDAVTHSEAFEHLKNAVQDTFAIFGAVIDTGIEAVGYLWDAFRQLFDGVSGTDVFTGLGEMVVAAVDVIVSAINMVLSVFEAVFGAIIGLATGDFTVLKNAWYDFCEGWSKLWTGIVDLIKGGVKVIVGLVSNIVNAMVNFGHAIANALSLDNVIAMAKKAIASLIDFLPDFMKPDSLKEWSANIKTDGKGEAAAPSSGSGESYKIPNSTAGFSLDDFRQNMATQMPTASQLVKAQNSNTVTNNRTDQRTVNNTVTINGADAEMTKQTLETLNDLEGNSYSVANSTMAIS